MEPLWNKYKERGFSVVAVEAARDTERATKLIRENKLSYHLLETEENNDVVDETFRIEWFPTSYLIDRSGRVMYCHVGFDEGDEVGLEKEIQDLLAGTEQASR